MLAPVILFVYKRLPQTMATLNALSKNLLASETDLIIFADGPKGANDVAHVADVRGYLRGIKGFKSVAIHEAETNKGLARSIVEGVTEVVDRYSHVIVLEDDIVTSPYFLQFMNDALRLYEQDEEVMSISGYMYPHTQQLPATFFFNVPLCWGWATWKRAWKHYNGSSEFHVRLLTESSGWKSFNKVGGTYLERQMRKNVSGKRNTWFVNWHASVFERNGFCLYPSTTLVNNIGFDSTGTHGASTNAYYSPLANSPVIVRRQPFIENEQATRLIKHFYRFKVNPYVKALIKFWRMIASKLKR